MSFETVVHMVLEHEGGYVNHPSDPGGETSMAFQNVLTLM